MTKGAILAIAVSSMSVAAWQQPPFRSAVELVEVDAVVVDDRGQVVRGLSREDFEVREDGARVPIKTFVAVNADAATRAADARFLVLVLDNYLTDPSRTTNIKNVARQFIERKGPHDVMAVMSLSAGNARTTTSAVELLADVDRFKPLGDSILQDVKQALNLMHDLVGQLSNVRHRRKALVFLGSGQLFRPTEFWGRSEDPGYSGEWLDAVQAAARANVSVYLIDPWGLTGAKYDGALSFASETGGRAFVNSNEFDRSVDRIWNEAGHYYLVGYEPPKSAGKKVHTIDVRVARPGVQVRARRTRG